MQGVICVPYYEIEEPLEAWYDLEESRSRIDYQDGTVKTFLIGKDLDYGAIYTAIPIGQRMKYFQVKGTKDDPICPQSPMPDPQEFKFEKTEYLKGVKCEVWRKVVQVGHKKNTYRLWVTRPEGADSPATPHRFQMQGFNTLLEAHNDNYTIDYSDFSTRTEPDVFTPPEGMTWEEFPDPFQNPPILANPIEDYVSLSPVSCGHRLFVNYKKKFDRQYKSEKEHEERENYFVQTVRFLHSTNRKGLSFTVGFNNRSDWPRRKKGDPGCCGFPKTD